MGGHVGAAGASGEHRFRDAVGIEHGRELQHRSGPPDRLHLIGAVNGQ